MLAHLLSLNNSVLEEALGYKLPVVAGITREEIVMQLEQQLPEATIKDIVSCSNLPYQLKDTMSSQEEELPPLVKANGGYNPAVGIPSLLKPHTIKPVNAVAQVIYDNWKCNFIKGTRYEGWTSDRECPALTKGSAIHRNSTRTTQSQTGLELLPEGISCSITNY